MIHNTQSWWLYSLPSLNTLLLITIVYIRILYSVQKYINCLFYITIWHIRKLKLLATILNNHEKYYNGSFYSLVVFYLVYLFVFITTLNDSQFNRQTSTTFHKIFKIGQLSRKINFAIFFFLYLKLPIRSTCSSYPFYIPVCTI